MAHLEFLVRMLAETFSWRNDVFVDDSERSVRVEFGVVVVGKGAVTKIKSVSKLNKGNFGSFATRSRFASLTELETEGCKLVRTRCGKISTSRIQRSLELRCVEE